MNILNLWVSFSLTVILLSNELFGYAIMSSIIFLVCVVTSAQSTEISESL